MRKGSVSRKRGSTLAFTVLFVVAASCGGDNGEAPETSSQNCAGCHTTAAAAWENFSSHRAIFGSCTVCHEEAAPEPGEGHRTSPWCDNCHSEVRHPPGSVKTTPETESVLFPTCTTCHYPMGSKNIYLIRENVLVDPGESTPVVFKNIEGRADDSFAELGAEQGGLNGREPGSGICEICHEDTRYYNRSGTGNRHSRARCTACHDHAIGFRVNKTD